MKLCINFVVVLYDVSKKMSDLLVLHDYLRTRCSSELFLLRLHHARNFCCIFSVSSCWLVGGSVGWLAVVVVARPSFHLNDLNCLDARFPQCETATAQVISELLQVTNNENVEEPAVNQLSSHVPPIPTVGLSIMGSAQKQGYLQNHSFSTGIRVYSDRKY